MIVSQVKWYINCVKMKGKAPNTWLMNLKIYNAAPKSDNYQVVLPSKLSFNILYDGSKPRDFKYLEDDKL